VKLLVGLGNPGEKYRKTRHNTGFLFLDKVSEQCSISFKKRVCYSLVGKGRIRGKEIILAKPLTYVNRSGRAVRELLHFYKLTEKDLLVVLDDFSLPLGMVRLRSKGSSGGHNGLESIIEALQTEDFPRLRIGIGPVRDLASNGIGREEIHEDWVSFVLSEFTPEERPILEASLKEGIETLRTFLKF